MSAPQVDSEFIIRVLLDSEFNIYCQIDCEFVLQAQVDSEVGVFVTLVVVSLGKIMYDFSKSENMVYFTTLLV